MKCPPVGLEVVARLLFCAGFVTFCTAWASAGETENGIYRVYVGTYTNQQSRGIYLLELDRRTGALTEVGLAAETVNPSFLAIHPSQSLLYAVNEISNFNGEKAGAVSAFAIDRDSGTLRLLNQQSTGGGGPCHLVIDQTGRYVLVANYGGGSVCSLPIREKGDLGPRTSFIQHEGSSVNPQRQKGPHGHSINLDSANRFAFAADLGLDKILIYRFDAKSGALEPHSTPFVSVAPGAGPRHFAFHPNGEFAYVINELNSTVTAFAYDRERGTLKELQTLPTLPEGFDGRNSTAEVVVHPSGKFLYGSNRGHHSLAIYRIDPEAGTLAPAGHQSTLGETPRNFAVTPDGKYILAGNQQSNTIAVFKVSLESGALEAVGEPVAAPSPICLRFLEKP